MFKVDFLSNKTVLTLNNLRTVTNMTSKTCEANFVVYVHGHKYNQETELQLGIS